MRQFEDFIRQLMSEIVIEDIGKSLQILKDYLNEKTKKHNTVINQAGDYAQLQHSYFNNAIDNKEYFQRVSSLRMKLVDFIGFVA